MNVGNSRSSIWLEWFLGLLQTCGFGACIVLPRCMISMRHQGLTSQHETKFKHFPGRLFQSFASLWIRGQIQWIIHATIWGFPGFPKMGVPQEITSSHPFPELMSYAPMAKQENSHNFNGWSSVFKTSPFKWLQAKWWKHAIKGFK